MSSIADRITVSCTSVPSTAARASISDNQSAELTAANFEGNTKLRVPDDFMAHFWAKKAETNPLIADRAILLKDIPEWANISDVLCLVFGGPIQRIWSREPNEVVVVFLNEADCEKYFDVVGGGIRLGDDLIEVQRALCDEISHEVQRCINNGTTRVVQVNVPNDKTLQDLEDIVQTLDLDHLEYHNEPNKPGRAFFFFCNIIDGHNMMMKLMKREWMNCQAQYINDPCEVNEGFHANGIAASALASATVESVRED